jgi:hypothetical protein
MVLSISTIKFPYQKIYCQAFNSPLNGITQGRATTSQHGGSWRVCWADATSETPTVNTLGGGLP